MLNTTNTCVGRKVQDVSVAQLHAIIQPLNQLTGKWGDLQIVETTEGIYGFSLKSKRKGKRFAEAINMVHLNLNTFFRKNLVAPVRTNTNGTLGPLLYYRHVVFYKRNDVFIPYFYPKGMYLTIQQIIDAIPQTIKDIQFLNLW